MYYGPFDGVHQFELSNRVGCFFFSQMMVTGLQEIDKLKGEVQDVQVPLEVFE